jgi:DNA-binding transcriptional regulator YiaG
MLHVAQTFSAADLRTRRPALALSQAALAQLLGLTPTTVALEDVWLM